MTTICPKCQHVRPADTAAPEWQCPACGVAYAKVSRSAAPDASPVGTRGVGYSAHTQRSGTPWRLIVIALALVAGLGWMYGARLMGDRPSDGNSAPLSVHDDAGIRRLATTIRAEQVLMYSTTECGYCAEARSWLHGHGFAFTECNMSVDSRCTEAFRALRASGTPYLIVRGPRGEHHMKDGFDSDEFLAALQG